MGRPLKTKRVLTPEQSALVAKNVALAYWAVSKVRKFFPEADTSEMVSAAMEYLCVCAWYWREGESTFSTYYHKSALRKLAVYARQLRLRGFKIAQKNLKKASCRLTETSDDLDYVPKTETTCPLELAEIVRIALAEGGERFRVLYESRFVRGESWDQAALAAGYENRHRTGSAAREYFNQTCRRIRQQLEQKETDCEGTT